MFSDFYYNFCRLCTIVSNFKNFFTLSLLVEVGMNQEVKINSNVGAGIKMDVYIQAELI